MTELTNTRKAAILRWLADQTRPEHALGDCALRFDTTVATLREMVTMHGFPKPESMRCAAGILDGTHAPVQAVPSRPAGTVPDPLLDRATRSTKAGTRSLGERIQKQLRDLRARLDAEDRAAEEKAERERIKAAAAAEVTRLREQLREAERALRGKDATPSAATTDSKAVRAWAAEQGIDCPKVGRVPATIRAAYDEAHKAAAS